MTIKMNALLGGVAAMALALGAPALAQTGGTQASEGQQQQTTQQQRQTTQTGAGQQQTGTEAGQGMQVTQPAGGGTGSRQGTEGGSTAGGDATLGVTTGSNQGGTQAQGTTQAQGATQPQDATQGTAAAQGTAADPAGQNLLIVTVGEAEIREADVMEALRNLPPQARQQPPQVLVPAVVNQLILRELVLEEARAAGLEEDPEVTAMVAGGGPEALEQALVRVWFERELADRVTEEDIQAAYEDMQQANPDMQQSLEEVRPQIQTMLQRQAAQTVGTELRQDAEVTFYDEAGNPVEMTPDDQGQQGQQGGGQQQQPQGQAQ